MHYYQFNIGDYRRDTQHFSMLEHGAYRQLLDWIYLDETPIPTETEVVMRRLCARTEDEKNAVLVVLKEMFELTENGYIQSRCMGEIAAYQSKADRARDNGKLGGRPPKTKEVISKNQEITQTKANLLTKEPINQLTIRTKEHKKEITFPEFLQICKDKNELPIPADDSIYGWAEKVKLPQDMLIIAWNAFKARTWKDAKGKEKKYTDWRKAFRQYCENPDWLDVWSINRDGEFYLTPKGKLLERELHE